MAKLYTRTGDDGSTGLFGGDRVSKHSLRVTAYGHADETNATVGMAVSCCGDTDARLREILLSIQSRLFDLGADLATPYDSPYADKVGRITAAMVEQAEAWIDEVDGDNSPMTSFVLPGGCELASRLHLARTVSRRCERSLSDLASREPCNEQALIWVNRLSDLLFAMARAANRLHGVEDIPWHPAD
ncbi:MAG TPA: cob(I)yrinic acid a,c-diamide adenosyltransferase [Phycisphaerales bacterium]|nr:cob(I)yrinic acid a,c-diamide adenosyltransferase [Phycisphaerales bacterium]